MAAPLDVVANFLNSCTKDRGSFHDLVRRHFTAETVWENVGLSVTTGPDEAIGLMDQFEAKMGIAGLTVDTLTIAASGNKVLTERIDYFWKANGDSAGQLRVMGIFEVAGDKIVSWQDYFDTAAFSNG